MNQRALVGKAVAVGQGVVNETLEQAINATHRYFLNHVFFEVNIHVHDVFMYDFTVHSPIWKLKSNALLDSTYSQFSLKKTHLEIFSTNERTNFDSSVALRGPLVLRLTMPISCAVTKNLFYSF